MEREHRTETLSQRRRQLISQGDGNRLGRRLPLGGDNGTSERREGARVEPSIGEEGPDGLIDGRFRLLRRLGSGRLGDVYEARIDGGPDAGIERRVALQLLDRAVTSDLAYLDKLRRGYAAIRAAPHRTLVSLDELGRNGNLWYLVMELLEGASVRFVIDDAGKLPADEAMPIVRSVGDALSYLHAKGMVHGAVRPGAVFITDDYEVKLLDIVPVLPPSVLPSDDEPPEPAAAPDAKDDVYGLACLAYELLTGRHPYNYATAAEARRLDLVPTPIPEIPPLRWRALVRGLAPERAHRPSQVSIFLQDLGIAESDRLTIAETPPSAAASDPMPLLTPDARERLAVASSPPDAGRGGRFWWVAALVVLASLVAAAWLYQDTIRDVAIARLATLGVDLAKGDNVAGLLGQSSGDQRGADTAGLDQVPASGEPRIGARPDNASGAPAPTDAGAAAAARAETEHDTASATGPPAELDTRVGTDFALSSEPGSGAQDPIAVEDPSAPAGGIRPDDAPAESATDQGLVADFGAALPAPGPATGPELEPKFFADQSVVRVREGNTFARVPVRREGGVSASATIVWWTTDDTAHPGDDYADFGERSEEFAPGESTLDLYIPIVNDGLPESLERFEVHLARPDPASGRLSPIGATRVEIEDDDNSLR